MNKFTKVTGYITNIQKSITFIYITEKCTKEIKKTILFTVASNTGPQLTPGPASSSSPVVSPAPGSRWILMNRPPNDSRTCHIQHSQTALITPGSHWAPVNPGSQNILVLASSCSLPFLLWSQDPSQAPRTGASCKCCKARLPYRAHTKPTTTKPGFQPTPAPGQFP